MADYFSFDDVVNELKVSEDDLKRMVSEGEIRAFRSDNKMKFRKEDIEQIRKGKTAEPTIILPASDSAETSTDLGLDLDIDSEALTVESAPVKPKSEVKPAVRPKSDVKPAAKPRPKSERVSAIPPSKPKSETAPALDLDLAAEEPEPLAVANGGEESSVADINLDDLKVAEEPAAGEPEETFIEEGSEDDSSAVTAPLALADESGEEATEEAETGEITDEGLEAEDATTAPGRRGGRRSARMPAYAGAAPAAKVGIVWVIFLFLGFVPAMAAAIFAVDFLMVEGGNQKVPSSMSTGAYDMVLEKMWKNGEWAEKALGDIGAKPTWDISIPDQNGKPVVRKYGIKHEGPTYKEPDLAAPAAPAGAPGP